ncbi:MAG: RHS repeat-associated protein, partial [Polaribacter sp.]
MCFWEGCSDEDDNGYIYPFAVYPGGLPGPLDDYYNEMNAHEVIQENHYYPFGMGMEGSWQGVTSTPDNKYTYNGKEMQDDLGLDWLDYGARMYDPSIGRWNAVDPLAEQYYSYSGYNYVLGNPINFIDPDGRSVEASEWKPEADNEGNITYVSEDNDSYETFVEQYGSEAADDVFTLDRNTTFSEGETGLSTNKPLKLLLNSSTTNEDIVNQTFFALKFENTVESDWKLDWKDYYSDFNNNGKM